MKKKYFKKNRFKFTFLILLGFMSSYLWATDYYVSALIGSNSNNGLYLLKVSDNSGVIKTLKILIRN